MTKDTKSKTDIDQQLIRDLAVLLDETGLSEIEVEHHGLKLRVARNLTVTSTVSAPAAAVAAAAPSAAVPATADAPADASKHPGAVPSPMVGTVYMAPEPGAPNFVDIGAHVSEGQTLLIIEAMKTMNHIPAPRSGTVTAILCSNEQPVEFGEPLVIIE
jgi:acetyl-CoA carboxylase biotin carboxyl carrier protein